MKSFKLEIPNTAPKDDLTIIYESGKDNLRKITTSKDDFLRTLHYFESRSFEIDQMKLVYIQEDVDFDIFNDFISSIQTKNILINESNYESYYYLSNKYEYTALKEQIEKFITTRPDIVSIIDLISPDTKSPNQDTEPIDFAKEELISKNLDCCIANGSLKKLPISMLIRILNSPKRKIKDHHLLFTFVKETIVERGKQKDLKVEEKENLFILPSCLDYCLMDSNEIEELFEVENSMPFFSPQNSDKKIKSFISREKEILQKYSEIESKLTKIEKNCNDRFAANEQKIDDEKAKFEQFQNQLAPKQIKNDERINEMDKKIIEIQKNFKSFDQNYQSKNNEVFQRIEKLEKSDDESKKKQKLNNDEIERHKSQLKTFENSIVEIKKQIEVELKKCSEIESSNQNLIKENEKMKESILMIKNSSLYFEKDPKVKNCSEGIFQYFFDKCKGNPVTKGLVRIDGNSDDGEEGNLPKLIDNRWKTSYWYSKDVENSYIKVDFTNSLVKIHKYRIRVGRTDGLWFFNSWTLKGTTEDGREVVLDEVNNSSEITKSHPEASFSIQNHSIVRSIQLIMKGKSDDNDYNMRLRNIELFGYLKSDLT